MAVTPIEAHCSRCRQSFHLFELLDERSGRCPRCGWALTQDWVHELLRHARAADIAQRQLVAALRGLRRLPGNIALRPHTVLRNLFEEVGWDRDLADDPALLREEISEIRRLLAAWELIDPQVAEAQPRRSWLRRSLDALLGRRPEPVLPPVGACDAPTPAAEMPAVTTTPSRAMSPHDQEGDRRCASAPPATPAAGTSSSSSFTAPRRGTTPGARTATATWT